jgi:tetratricopeptide (TPR) repeat protein
VNWWQRWRQARARSESIDLVQAVDSQGSSERAESSHHAEHADKLLLDQASAMLAQGDALEAIAFLENSLVEAVEPARLHLAIGKMRWKVPDIPGAEEAFSVAVSLDPALGEAWLRLGEVQARLERFGEGIETLKMALTVLDETLRHEALTLLAKLLMRNDRYQEARVICAQALDIVEEIEGLKAAAEVEFWLGDDAQAVSLLERLVEIDGPLEGRARTVLAMSFRNMGRWADTRRLLEQEVALQPRAAYLQLTLAHVLLACCEWDAGWAGYRHRFAAGAVPYRPLPYRTWTGAPTPDQAVVVIAEQGLGDEIMFASCLPDVIRRVGHCIVECEPRLAKLFGRSFPDATVLPTRREGDGSWLDQVMEPDWQICSGDLPALFRRRDQDFPAHAGYLRADPERVSYWRNRLSAELGPGMKVGISWRGGTAKTRSRARSLASSDWAPILKVPGCAFVNLQYGECGDMLQQFQEDHGISVAHYPEVLADYDETAALVCALDLVLSVCTAIIHLAGALGRPVWIMAPLAPEWRYTAERDVMPWYPTSRVRRQQLHGDWASVCQQVSLELQKLTHLCEEQRDKSEESGSTDKNCQPSSPFSHPAVDSE